MDTEQQACLFRALADPTRLRILSIIAAGNRPYGQQIEEALDFAISQSGISFHLKILQKARLVAFTPDKTRRCYYCPRPAFIKRLLAIEQEREASA